MKRLTVPHAVIVERHDGFYWQDSTGGREYGPFRTLVEAELDAMPDTVLAFEAVEDLDIGAADWIDPDTGDLGWAGMRSEAAY